VIDIQTKGYVPDKSGSVSVAGGSRDQGEAGVEAVGSSGAFSYSLIGSYLHSNLVSRTRRLNQTRCTMRPTRPRAWLSVLHTG